MAPGVPRSLSVKVGECSKDCFHDSRLCEYLNLPKGGTKVTKTYTENYLWSGLCFVCKLPVLNLLFSKMLLLASRVM